VNSRCCCRASAPTEEPRPLAPLQRAREAVRWLIPGVILIAMPKCPMCVAAYIALFTGVGISLTAAASLRILVLALCLATIAVLAAKRAGVVIPWSRLRSRCP